MDDISFETINIEDEINYISKTFDVGNQNQKITSMTIIWIKMSYLVGLVQFLLYKIYI